MSLVRIAMQRPVTVVVVIIATALGSLLALSQSRIDIFPDMGVPIIYVAQPYGGMDPAQMEGFITNYYEYHFLYITGIEHVESKSIQGVALMKLFFHPGTNMAQAMAETISYVNRSRSFMPPGTVPPFVMRFDAGSVPVGFLVFSSPTRSIREIQDEALFRVRPIFATLPGVSAPPPFGGNQRTIVVSVDADKLLAYQMSPEEIVNALSAGNAISPSGNAYIGNMMPMVRTNSVASDIKEMEKIAIRTGNPSVFVRDVGHVEDASDIPSGYALVDGRKTVYIPVTKRADASTLSVVREVKAALPRMQTVVPGDLKITFEFDQSTYVTRAIRNLAIEGGLGAVLTGLMVLLFLRDLRSALIIVLNIPLALMAAMLALWLAGQTINLMTLGGLALAIGILVDEATVAIENIHSHVGRTPSLARAVLNGSVETTVPRFLAMLCILAVFIPSFFMAGVGRAMFVPLSLAVGFAMLASYFLSSTFVPVMTTWILRLGTTSHTGPANASFFERTRERYRRLLDRVVAWRSIVIVSYAIGATFIIWLIGTHLGVEIFPAVDTGQFQIRFRAPDGTRFERTEQLAQQVIGVVKDEVGPDNVIKTLGYVGSIPTSYPINTIYLWMSGPHEGVLRMALNRKAGISVPRLQETLRHKLTQAMPDVTFSFEAGDIVSDVMSFGSPTPIEIAVSGPNLDASRTHAEKIREQLARIPSLRDIQYGQSLNYPVVDVVVDRELAGMSHASTTDVTRSLVAATSSSRYVVPNFWADPKTGIGYQVQIELPTRQVDSVEAIQNMPVGTKQGGQLLIRNVAAVNESKTPGEYDRYNMQRTVSLTANIHGEDLGRVIRQIDRALTDAGAAPSGVTVTTRGQVPPLQQMLRGLFGGLGLTILVILLLLAAYFQSFRSAIVVVSTVPAVISGVVLALLVTRTTLNVQSFMGAIMAVGVAVANAILLTTFAERSRSAGASAQDASVDGAQGRLRPILMTSFAMIAGMLPTALGLGESGEQIAPLGRAVIGGLALGTVATLFILPCVFSTVLGRSSRQSASIDPDDPGSSLHDVPDAKGAK